MTNMMLAIICYVGIIAAVTFFLGKLGKWSFWKLAAKLPEEAFEHFSADPTWLIGAQAHPGEGFVGPFLHHVPSRGQTVKLYARDSDLESSQQNFIERHASQVPRHGFPYLSALALLFPVAAMASMRDISASTVLILGYGFANLGYLLGAAFLIPGHFRILGLDGRLPTLIAGVLFWVVGLVLSNVVSA